MFKLGYVKVCVMLLSGKGRIGVSCVDYSSYQKMMYAIEM